MRVFHARAVLYVAKGCCMVRILGSYRLLSELMCLTDRHNHVSMIIVWNPHARLGSHQLPRGNRYGNTGVLRQQQNPNMGFTGTIMSSSFGMLEGPLVTNWWFWSYDRFSQPQKHRTVAWQVNLFSYSWLSHQGPPALRILFQCFTSLCYAKSIGRVFRPGQRWHDFWYFWYFCLCVTCWSLPVRRLHC